MKYQVTKFENGKYGVIDTQAKPGDCKTVAAGMNEETAKDWAEKLNERHDQWVWQNKNGYES